MSFSNGTRGGGRTRTPAKEPDFESGASANSATRAIKEADKREPSPLKGKKILIGRARNLGKDPQAGTLHPY